VYVTRGGADVNLDFWHPIRGENREDRSLQSLTCWLASAILLFRALDTCCRAHWHMVSVSVAPGLGCRAAPEVSSVTRNGTWRAR